MDEVEVVVEKVEQPDHSGPQGSETPPTPNDHLVLRQHFNIDMPTEFENKKLAAIWEFAKSKSKTGDMSDVMWQVIHLSGDLGAPRLGESKLDKVYRWVTLKTQESRIQEQLRQV